MDGNKENKDSLIDITNINQKVYQNLRKKIVYRDYPPGHKLTIRELQKTFGVSNSPIKDALFKLAGEGFVEISSRKGTYVKDITIKDILEIEQTRIIIEAGAVEVVAQKISDEELAKLEQLYENTLMRGKKFDYMVFMERDFEFHNEIIRLTENDRLTQIYEQLNAHLQIARFKVAQNIKKRLPWTNSDHRKIIKALSLRNPQKAREAVTEHRVKARNALLEREEIDIYNAGSSSI